MDLQYYDKNELIKKNLIFDNNNIICENNGDIISKIIIGNILNNTTLNHKNSLELSRKYQVLSKYTSLYAEVENEYVNQKEMLIIEQNKERDNKSDSESDIESVRESDSDSRNYRKSKRNRYRKRKKFYISSDSESEKKCKKKAKISSESDSESEKPKKKYKKMAKISNESDSESEDKKSKCKEKFDIISYKPDKKSKKKANKRGKGKNYEGNESNNKSEKNFDIKEMILTQNIIEGNWSLNSQTKFLIDSNIDLYNKIKEYVDKFNVGEKKEDIIITILVIFFLKNNKEIDQSEYTIIINKGIEYLQTIGIEELLFKNIEVKLK